MGVPPVLIHFNRIFPEINHPAIGVPPVQTFKGDENYDDIPRPYNRDLKHLVNPCPIAIEKSLAFYIVAYSIA